MRPSSAARRYAEAAFDVAREDGEVERWLAHLDAVRQTLTDPRAAAFFKDPNATTGEKLATLDRMFPQLAPHTRNLLSMLAERERLHLVPSIYAEFQSLDREARGILEATITVARPFEPAEREEIARRLGQATGKSVEVQMDVDPSILGGIVVRIGDRLIDASVASRLQRLRHEMAV